jgi:hypothetical protein
LYNFTSAFSLDIKALKNTFIDHLRRKEGHKNAAEGDNAEDIEDLDKNKEEEMKNENVIEINDEKPNDLKDVIEETRMKTAKTRKKRKINQYISYIIIMILYAVIPL